MFFSGTAEHSLSDEQVQTLAYHLNTPLDELKKKIQEETIKHVLQRFGLSYHQFVALSKIEQHTNFMVFEATEYGRKCGYTDEYYPMSEGEKIREKYCADGTIEFYHVHRIQ